MIFAYIRVSSKEQHLNRQIDAINDYCDQNNIRIDRIIEESESGKTLERARYLALRNELLRQGDVLIITSLDRLGRNKNQLKEEIEYYKKINVRLKILDLPTSLIEIPKGQEWILDMINNILIEVLSSMAEQERLTTKERQRQGIEAARRRGIALGRPEAPLPSEWKEVYTRWKQGEITATDAFKNLKMSKTNFYKKVKTYEKTIDKT